MSSNSSIEWTEATWNPVTGCTIVSPGCTHCYAMRMAARLEAMGKPQYVGTTRKVNEIPIWTGKINLIADALPIPLRRRKPTMYFVNSMSDLFHEEVPFDFIDGVFAVMALTPQHTYQILTKRPERMVEYLNVFRGRSARVWTKAWNVPDWCDSDNRGGIEAIASHRSPEHEEKWPLPNVWLGTSCERQKEADERIPHLLKCPAAVRFLSCEPLLGPIDLNAMSRTVGAAKDEITDDDDAHGPALDDLHWVIVGGESGPGSRECSVEWVRQIQAQCSDAGVACFVKQLGAKPIAQFGHDYSKRIDGQHGVSAYVIEHKAWPKGPDEPLGSRPQIRSDGLALLNDPKGGDPQEWPVDLRVRQFPNLEATP